jgi:predicted RNase H-like nuclease (RuvC/YqgF family)
MVAESPFALLHDRLFRVREFVQALQSENMNLRKEIRQLKQDLEEFEKENDSKRQLVRRFEHNRLKIRSRVEKILQNIATLEEPTGG